MIADIWNGAVDFLKSYDFGPIKEFIKYVLIVAVFIIIYGTVIYAIFAIVPILFPTPVVPDFRTVIPCTGTNAECL